MFMTKRIVFFFVSGESTLHICIQGPREYKKTEKTEEAKNGLRQ